MSEERRRGKIVMEQRITYDAFSSDDQRYSAEDGIHPQGEQHRNGACFSERVVFVPMFESLQTNVEHPHAPCLHLVRLHDARLGLCNVLTDQRCGCCHCPMCEEHQSAQWIALPDGQGVWHEEQAALLCRTCALLPREAIYTFHTFWLSINQ